MRVMGVDYGDRRTGVAFSDVSGTLAGEAFTLEIAQMDQLVKQLCMLAKDKQVEEIVVGYPKNMNATVGERAQKAEMLADSLRQQGGLSVVLWDERLTSVDAHRILHDNGRREKRHKKVVDAVAATIILQNYLDFKRRHP